jgi:hypothetical protein
MSISGGLRTLDEVTRVGLMIEKLVEDGQVGHF